MAKMFSNNRGNITIMQLTYVTFDIGLSPAYKQYYIGQRMGSYNYYIIAEIFINCTPISVDATTYVNCVELNDQKL